MTSPEQSVLILGAGINGAALARELLLNRVPVCLVDTADICFGATAASSRLIHGGLRYLEYGEFDLVRESLAERTRLLRLAPQFVKPLRLLIPVRTRTGGMLAAASRLLGRSLRTGATAGPRGLWLVRMGLWLYELYARDATLPRRGVHSIREGNLPPVNAAVYRWFCSYYDAQIARPERFVLALLEDARRLAAEQELPFQLWTCHRARLEDGQVSIHPVCPHSTASATDDAGDAVAAFRPAAIVNATGAWVDQTLSQLHVPAPRLIGGTKGSHLLTSHEGLRTQIGADGLYVEAADGRPVFILPFGNLTLIGTTDLPFDEEPQQAVATRPEIEYLVQTVNETLPGVGLTREDIDLHYCGVRPLPATGQQATSAITRRHWLEEHHTAPLPFFSVIGGKLTTCRSLAESGARTVMERLGRQPIASSRERFIPGGESYPVGEAALRNEHERLAQQFGYEPAQIEAVWDLCGTRTRAILDEARAFPTSRSDLSQNLPGTWLPLSFVRWVIRHEWVRRLEDLVERRLLLLHHPRLSEACLRQLAALLVEADVLRESAVAAAIENCRNRLILHYGKRLAP